MLRLIFSPDQLTGVVFLLFFIVHLSEKIQGSSHYVNHKVQGPHSLRTLNFSTNLPEAPPTVQMDF